MKRALDFTAAAAVLLLFLPILAVLAAAIRLDSRGPVLYRAERVGQGGRRLRMLKFRKMREDAHALPLTLSDDDRFTRVGRFLSKTKLDELPQFWHVLKGDMSLVGPRPEDPRFVAARAEDYEHILAARPGITGLSQIAFLREGDLLRAAADPVSHYHEHIFPRKVRLDRLYVAQATLRRDVQIIFWTLAALWLPVSVDPSGKPGLEAR